MIALASGALVSACSPTASELRGLKPGDTQIVVQWQTKFGTTNAIQSMLELNKYTHAETIIESASGGVYFEDGNDMGRGLFNVFLYTSDIDATVQRVIALERDRKIPKGVRIGVAIYKDRARTDWTYRPVFPADLKQFGIF